MVRYLVVGLFALGIAAPAGYLLYGRRWRERDTVARVAALEQRIHELELARETDATALRNVLASVAKVAAVSGRAAGEAVARDAYAEQGAAPASDADQSPRRGHATAADDRSPEALQGRREAFLAGLDQAIERPPTDPSWGIPTLREAEAAVASTLPGARIVDKRCGGDLCRIVVEHGSGEDASAADADLMQLSPFNRGSTIAHAPGNGREATLTRIYLSRTTAGAAHGS